MSWEKDIRQNDVKEKNGKDITGAAEQQIRQEAIAFLSAQKSKMSEAEFQLLVKRTREFLSRVEGQKEQIKTKFENIKRDIEATTRFRQALENPSTKSVIDGMRNQLEQQSALLQAKRSEFQAQWLKMTDSATSAFFWGAMTPEEAMGLSAVINGKTIAESKFDTANELAKDNTTVRIALGRIKRLLDSGKTLSEIRKGSYFADSYDAVNKEHSTGFFNLPEGKYVLDLVEGKKTPLQAQNDYILEKARHYKSAGYGWEMLAQHYYDILKGRGEPYVRYAKTEGMSAMWKFYKGSFTSFANTFLSLDQIAYMAGAGAIGKGVGALASRSSTLARIGVGATQIIEKSRLAKVLLPGVQVFKTTHGEKWAMTAGKLALNIGLDLGKAIGLQHAAEKIGGEKAGKAMAIFLVMLPGARAGFEAQMNKALSMDAKGARELAAWAINKYGKDNIEQKIAQGLADKMRTEAMKSGRLLSSTVEKEIQVKAAEVAKTLTPELEKMAGNMRASAAVAAEKVAPVVSGSGDILGRSRARRGEAGAVINPVEEAVSLWKSIRQKIWKTSIDSASAAGEPVIKMTLLEATNVLKNSKLRDGLTKNGYRNLLKALQEGKTEAEIVSIIKSSSSRKFLKPALLERGIAKRFGEAQESMKAARAQHATLGEAIQKGEGDLALLRQQFETNKALGVPSAHQEWLENTIKKLEGEISTMKSRQVELAKVGAMRAESKAALVAEEVSETVWVMHDTGVSQWRVKATELRGKIAENKKLMEQKMKQFEINEKLGVPSKHQNALKTEIEVLKDVTKQMESELSDLVKILPRKAVVGPRRREVVTSRELKKRFTQETTDLERLRKQFEINEKLGVPSKHQNALKTEIEALEQKIRQTEVEMAKARKSVVREKLQERFSEKPDTPLVSWETPVLLEGSPKPEKTFKTMAGLRNWIKENPKKVVFGTIVAVGTTLFLISGGKDKKPHAIPFVPPEGNQKLEPGQKEPKNLGAPAVPDTHEPKKEPKEEEQKKLAQKAEPAAPRKQTARVDFSGLQPLDPLPTVPNDVALPPLPELSSLQPALTIEQKATQQEISEIASLLVSQKERLFAGKKVILADVARTDGDDTIFMKYKTLNGKKQWVVELDVPGFNLDERRRGIGGASGALPNIEDVQKAVDALIKHEKETHSQYENPKVTYRK